MQDLALPMWLTAAGAQRHGAHRIAMRDENGSMTYAELAEAMAGVGAGLLETGLRPGDVVVTAMEPSIPHVVALLGAMRAGMIAAPLGTRLTSSEAVAYLEHLQPAAVVTDHAHADLAHTLGHRVIDLPEADASTGDRLAPLRRAPVDLPAPGENDPAIIFPTGGTTGAPKGAVHTHRTLWLWLNTCAHGNPRVPTDVELCFSPFFHITLGTNLFTPLLAGGEVWIQRRFDAGAALEAIDRGATRLMGAPTMFTALRAHPQFDSVDRSGVTAIRYGSTPSTGEFIHDLMRDFPNARIRAGFGATEFGSVIGFDHEDLLAGRVSGIGRPLPGVTVRVLTGDGQEAGPGEVGELVVSCPWQTIGYYGRREDTAETYRCDGVHVGDLATRDADGWLSIVGRSKEMIISGGENVFPREVETVLLDHPAVADVIVYGVPDEFWGERVEAAVVPAGGAIVEAEQLRDHCRARLAGFKIPKAVRTIESIPLTPNNKPDRRAVRAAALTVTG
ncbi:class I adenylate-forming enzyme family protein [Gordonia neofelifaecis]|uniref:class I adenylate-forming enzyme family protein n=1 Tax=Gordonia neofelifaecis TaxID=945692 RepID=UPI000301634C|nr:class I adenylate-forming enzyme family protein [Gordonia neofelifaecis]